MMQTELWMLTPFFVFTLIKISVINADNNSKNQRKLDNQEENYIITHYGREYYTPAAADNNVQAQKSGYFTAEVIPVDVNTGEELKSVKNIFVPMHTGYSISPNTAATAHQPQYQQHSLQQLSSEKHNKMASSNKRTPLIATSQQTKESADTEISPKENIDGSKSKIPKKFKNKLTFGVKKKSATEFNESTAPERVTEYVQNEKNIPKRHIGEIPPEFLAHLFNRRRFEMVPERRWNHVNYYY